MDLIDRYVAAIRNNLPKDKAADIAAELTDELQSRREDREEALGRPMTAEETSAMLKDFGHPLLIAARYRSRQYLIGPDVYPFYLFALKIVLAVGTALLVGIGIVSMVLGRSQIVEAAIKATGELWFFFFFSVAAVTLVFAILERFGFPAHHVSKWTPEQLPDLADRPRNQWESALEVGLGIAFLLWWTGVVRFPQLASGGGVRIEAAPIWDQFYLPILLIALVQLTASLMKWLRPRWKVAVSLLTIGASVALLAVIAGVYRAERWIIVVATGPDAANAERLTESVNLALQIAFIVVSIMMVLQVLGEIWKLARPRVARLA